MRGGEKGCERAVFRESELLREGRGPFFWQGTEVQCKGYLPGYYSTRYLNEDSNSGSWPLYYGDETLTNGRYYNGCMPTLPRAIANAYTGYEMDVLKHDNAWA
ncbi:hypothetical protein PVL29_010425 [Vitis rotundifolia]|uniref:Uncharacterized protein n=1 Tax=Vitis rotundifolia TaxID=103349 RepID=A0AA38ZTE3_VITRO|nr:hypothetical protein PVL29_010425 [Vitis rotundifolia]